MLATAITVGSLSFTLIKIVLRDLSPISLAAGRVVFSAAAFASVVVLQPHRRTPIRRGDRLRVVLCGLGGSAGFHLLFNWGQSRVSVAVSAVVLGTMPAVVAAGEMLFLRHRLAAVQFAGLALSLIGIAVISLTSGGGTTSSTIGIVAVAAATVVWSAVTVATRSLADRYDPWWLNTPGTLLGAVVMIVIAAPSAHEFGHLSPRSWIFLIWLGVVSSAFIYAALAKAMAVLSATTTASLSTLVTPVGIGVAWVALGERPSLFAAIGAVTVLAGVTLVSRPRSSGAATDRVDAMSAA